MRIFFLLVLLASAHAQLSNLPDLSTATPAAPTGASSNEGSTTGKTSAPATSSNAAASSTEVSSTAPTSDSPSSSTSPSPSSTASGDTSSLSNAPSLTSAIVSLSNLPTIAGAGVPTMIVPNTANAPFMQKSNLPEGTVFICVGAILGFLGISVLAWRGMTAWSIHRSVQRAAVQQNVSDNKAMLRAPGAGFYSTVPGSNLSLDHLNSSGKPGTKSKSHTPTGSLFFSPTAGAGMHSGANRSSNYLPAGYYATGAAAPAGGNATAHIGGSLSNMGTQSQSYTRARSVGPSPPASPALPPSRGGDGIYGRPGSSGLYADRSQSSLNLNAPPQGRAPSAYLEDLFENHGNGPRERF